MDNTNIFILKQQCVDFLKDANNFEVYKENIKLLKELDVDIQGADIVQPEQIYCLEGEALSKCFACIACFPMLRLNKSLRSLEKSLKELESVLKKYKKTDEVRSNSILNRSDDELISIFMLSRKLKREDAS